MELISREQVIATIDSFNVFESRSDQIKLELMIGELPIAGVGTNLAEVGTDLISRAEAIDAARDWYEGLICGSFKGLEKRLRALPPAEPKRGKWIHHPEIGWGETWLCDQCGEKTTSTVMGKPRANFCPNCGADMRGDSDE